MIMSSMETNSITKIVGRRGKEHAGERKQDEGIVFRGGDDAVGKLSGNEQHEHGRDDKEPLEKQRKAIIHEGAMEGGAGQAGGVH